MRSLIVMFFFFVLIFGVGTVVLSAELTQGFDSAGSNFVLGQVSDRAEKPDVSTQVDRYDDPLTLTACTSGERDPIAEAARRMSAPEFVQPYHMPVATLTDQDGEPFDLRL
ncbi:MAG: hypothetical protein R3293_17545, partial [Candidatus Promineifilaceae bacterium]|nr:hypothetical protein [Candidatus Promineifilaceae bacterium]